MSNIALSLDQQYAFSRFRSGHNIFVTGPGGTGKTRLIQHVVNDMNDRGKKFQVCALTGCAALLLQCGAKTIHSWSGIRIAKGSTADIVNRILRTRKVVTAWKNIQVLIVDEVSMLSARMFDLLDDIGKRIRRDNRPFGGIQLVFTGDFFQLPPIPDANGDPTSALFCFESPRWTNTFSRENCIPLTTYFRQTDPTYIAILEEVRIGTLCPEHAAILESRTKLPLPTDLIPTKLFPIRQKVDYVNTTMYASLAGEERVYDYTSKIDERFYVDTTTPIPYELLTKCRDLTKTETESEIEQLLSSTQTEKQIRLKIGTSVMCTINLHVDAGICNGSQGIVVGFCAETGHYPLVRFKNGKTIKMEPHKKQSDEYPSIVVSQLPLCMAWALTIHKIQGATLDAAEMDIGKSVFEYGQTYVALSRIKSLDGLYLSEFIPHRIRANPDVVAFYRSFPHLSRESMEAEIKRTTTDFSSFALTPDTGLSEESYVPSSSDIKRIRIS